MAGRRGKPEVGFGELFGEPLFLVSIFSLIVVFLRPLLAGGSMYGITHIALFFLFLLSCYFTYIYVKEGNKNRWLYGIPLILLIIALFAFYADRYEGRLQRDYDIFNVLVGITLLFYTLTAHKIIKPNHAAILSIFIIALIAHNVPAQAPYLSALDPYWHLKWAERIVDTGSVPDHDYMTYPYYHGGIHNFDASRGPGLDLSWVPLMNPVVIGYLTVIIGPLGFTTHDVATMFPGVVAAFTILMSYLLIRDLFDDYAPYNYVAALLCAFMLIFSPAFAAKAIATNAEDDSFGMFLLVSSFFLLVSTFRKKSIMYAIFAAFSFFVLRLTWGGYIYGVIICSVFAVFYALSNYLHKSNCMEHIPYLVISVVPSFFTSMILHRQGGVPNLSAFYPGDVITISLGGAVFASVIFEMVRRRQHGPLKVEVRGFMDRIDKSIQTNINLLGVLILLAGLAFIVSYGPLNIFTQIKETVGLAKASTVVQKTIAEQNPLANNPIGFIEVLPKKFGILGLYAVFMVPFLLHLGFARRSLGAIFVLSWSLPMLWGVFYKSQYLFVASVPITVLGSTVGLYSVMKKQDLQTLRIVGGIFVVITPLLTLPFFGAGTYDRFVGPVPFYMGPSGDRYYWDPALIWLKENTSEDEAVLTWWDYGHWITSVSQRPVIIDNLQADEYEIQDVAQFFVNKTDEASAFETFDAYDRKYGEQGVKLKYVVIDWTMIGKGSALHFIATGNITSRAEGSFKNYAHCQFMPQNSDQSPRLVTMEDGSLSYVQRLVFGCTPVYIGGVIFDVVDNKISGISVVDLYGSVIPWSSYIADNDASLLGVQSLRDIIGLAAARPTDNIMPTYRNLIYVPEEFSDFMMTRLYLGDHLEEYKAMGLYNREVEPLKHFKKIQDFSAGFVRIYEVVDEVEESPPVMGLEGLDNPVVVVDDEAADTGESEAVDSGLEENE